MLNPNETFNVSLSKVTEVSPYTPKKLGVIIIVTVGLISGMITISLNWSFVCTTYSALTNILYQALMKPVSILITIFGLSALSLMNLTFYLTCKHKNSHKKIISQNNNSENDNVYSKFVPTSEMIVVMKLLKNGVQFYRKQIHSQLTYEYDYTKHLINTLEKECFLDVVLPNDLVDQLTIERDEMKLELSEPGRTYLIDNNLI